MSSGIFQLLSSCSSSLNYEEVKVYFFILFSFPSLQLILLVITYSYLAVTIDLEISFYLKRLVKRGLPRLFCKLFLAKFLRLEGDSYTPPIPFSLVYINEMRAVIMVRMFHDALQVSLWQCVKVVQMGFPTQNRPFSVRNLILGGENGQSSGSSITPWQNPLEKSSSRPKRQKWKLRASTRVTKAWG